MKGTEAKNSVFAKIIGSFPNAFWFSFGKILRVPVTEKGEIVEIKVQLTAAKNILGGNNTVESSPNNHDMNFEQAPANMIEPTPQGEETVQNLLKSLGMI